MKRSEEKEFKMMQPRVGWGCYGHSQEATNKCDHLSSSVAFCCVRLHAVGKQEMFKLENRDKETSSVGAIKKKKRLKCLYPSEQSYFPFHLPPPVCLLKCLVHDSSHWRCSVRFVCSSGCLSPIQQTKHSVRVQKNADLLQLRDS